MDLSSGDVARTDHLQTCSLAFVCDRFPDASATEKQRLCTNDSDFPD
jgi:hypothetical protein